MTTVEANDRYPCHVCKKSFSTNSHLRRHESLHSGRISAICPGCDKRFSRLDAARRHAKACCPDGPERVVSQVKRGKAVQACDACARRKLSCDTENPCSRCASSGVSCTYERQKDKFSGSSAGEEFSPYTDTASSTTSADTNVQVRGGRIPIEFLLAFTNPVPHKGISTLIANSDRDSAPVDTVILNSPPGPNFDFYTTLFWDQEDWLPEFFESFGQDDPDSVHRNRLTRDKSQAPLISRRLHEIVEHLAATHARLLSVDPDSNIKFDAAKARELFTVENLETNFQAYFQRVHEFYNVIHVPTFKPETASLRVLLAVFLFGSLACGVSDAPITAREFFDIAEEYIFSHPIMQANYQNFQTTKIDQEELEVFQAAMLTEAFQNGTYNERTRTRMRLIRHPLLVTKLRAYGFYSSLPEAEPIAAPKDWKEAMLLESRIRLANMTFVVDSCFCIMFNSCPLLNISDLMIPVPSIQKVWEAETEDEFESMTALDLSRPKDQTTFQLIQDLLKRHWDQSIYLTATAVQLGMAMVSLQSMLMIMKYSQQLEAARPSLLRALDRWEKLWGDVLKIHEAEPDFIPGFHKHNMELATLVRALIRADEAGYPGCRYVKSIPTDEVKHLHDFLKMYNAK